MKWLYPDSRYIGKAENVFDILAELWEDGVRRAFIMRDNGWPDKSYIICVRTGPHPQQIDRVEMQGDFIQAQETAYALAILN